MSLQVESQVIRPGECPVTHPALERPVTRMLPHVTRQLVRPGKLPSTLLPRAHVWLLSGVRPQMCLQVARFRVRLATTWMLAGVRGQLALEAQLPLQHFLLGAQQSSDQGGMSAAGHG